jgi:predicted small metal-binding protein
MASTRQKEQKMKVVHCECGTDVSGESDDELVSNVEAHVSEHHPEMEGKMGREQILEMAHDH